MLQKLSKCEVKVDLVKFENLTVTLILREIKFWKIQMVILDTLNFKIW